MGKETGIPWCDKTFNPWWGCVEVSAECDHCYARTLDARFDGGHWGDTPRRFFGEKHWTEPLRWNASSAAGWKGKDGRRTLVFCASMCDVFEANDALEPWRFKLWGLIKATPALTWLLLTKRPQLISKMLPDELVGAPNIWLGTTVGMESSLWRADALIKHGMLAPVRFLSMEPLLEVVSVADKLQIEPSSTVVGATGINWVIAGSESGDGARPMPTNAMRLAREQCRTAGVPFFAKQADQDAEGISCDGGEMAVTVADDKVSAHPPYRRRDLRMGPDGMRRTHWIVERPFLDGKQEVAWPA